jgi:ABC-type glycerol-3-phosphate transport system substrate-binding protein
MKQENVLIKMDSNIYDLQSAGKIAFLPVMMGIEDNNVFQADSNKAYKVGIMPLPNTKIGFPLGQHRSDRSYFISEQSPAPQACWDWIKFLSSQPTSVAGIPARTSMVNSSEWEASVGKERAAAYRAALANFKPLGEADNHMNQVQGTLFTWYWDAVKAAFNGQALKPVLAALQQKADGYLRCVQATDPNVSLVQHGDSIQACYLQAESNGGGLP